MGRTMSALENFPRITPFLWFDSNAEEAVNFYLSIFDNSRRLDELRKPDGGVLTIAFELDGQKFTALNGGPAFKFSEAISLTVRCDSQQEIDNYWAKLSAGGGEVQCGWIQGQVRSLLADRSRKVARSGQTPEGHGGDDGHEEAQHRRAGARSTVVADSDLLSNR